MTTQGPPEQDKIAQAISVVPEIYYDMISRVPVGIMTVLGTVWLSPPLRPTLDFEGLKDLGWAPTTVLVGLLLLTAYTVGLLLTQGGHWVYWMYHGALWREEIARHSDQYVPLIRMLNKKLDLHLSTNADTEWDVAALSGNAFSRLDHAIHDYLKRADPHSRVILPKLRAEGALCNNLVAGYVVLFLMHAIWTVPAIDIGWRGGVALVLVLALTVSAAWYRNGRVIERHFSLLTAVLSDHKLGGGDV